MQKLLIATTNEGKLAEYKKYLGDLSFEFVTLKDLHIGSVEETGKTFEENAILKAKTYFEKTGLPCIADDGGLEIDALNGEPGIYSRRWKTGDENVTDEELVEYTLERMRDVPEGRRSARMHSVSAFVDQNGKVHTADATTEGYIATEVGSTIPHGLPYRAILFLPQFKKFYADLNPEEALTVNQRVQAIQKLKHTIAKAFTLE